VANSSLPEDLQIRPAVKTEYNATGGMTGASTCSFTSTNLARLKRVLS